MERPTAKELATLAAALETPGDLTKEELEQAHQDIVSVLLWFAYDDPAALPCEHTYTDLLERLPNDRAKYQCYDCGNEFEGPYEE